MQSSVLLSSLITAQRQLQSEKLFLQEEYGELQLLRDRVSNLKSAVPMLAVQVRELDTKVEAYRSGECTIEEAYDSLATLSKSTDVFRERRSKYEDMVRALFFDPALLAQCGCASFMQLQRPSVGLRREAADFARVAVFGLYGNVCDPFSEYKLLCFLRNVIDYGMAVVASPKELFDMTLIKKLLPSYTRRVGREYLTTVFRDVLSSVVHRDDLDVSLQREKVAEDTMGLTAGLESRSSSSGSISSMAATTPVTSKSASANFKALTPSGKPAPLPLSTSVVSSEEDLRRALLRNQANLYQICIRIVSNLTQSLPSMPYGLRFLAREILDAAKRHHPNAEAAEIRASVQHFFFVCLLNLAIIDPERHGIVVDAPVRESDREKLTVIANVMRHTAFGLLFPEKSPYAGMNIFIAQNSEALSRFFDAMVMVTDAPMREAENGRFLSVDEGSFQDFHKSCAGASVITNSEVYLLHKLLLRLDGDKLSDKLRQVLSALNGPPPTVDEETRYCVLNEIVVPRIDIDPNAEIAAADSDCIPKPFLRPFQQLQSVLALLPMCSPSNYCVSQKSGEDLPDSEDCILLSTLERWSHKELAAGAVLHATCLAECIDSIKKARKASESCVRELIRVFDKIVTDSEKRKSTIGLRLSVEKNKFLHMSDMLSRYSGYFDGERKSLLSFLQVERIKPYFVNQVLPAVTQLFESESSTLHHHHISSSATPVTPSKQAGHVFVSEDVHQPMMRYSRFLHSLLQEVRGALVRNRFTAAEIDHALELFERFVSCRVYDSSFGHRGNPFTSSICTDKDKERDRNLQIKLSSLSSVQPHHLDILPQYCLEKGWKLIAEELKKISSLRSPQEKLSSMVGVCKSIFEVMKFCVDVETSNTARILPAMDDFLPILIYIIIQANPSHLHSTFVVMASYLSVQQSDRKNFVYSEHVDYSGEYWFPHFEAAIMWLEELDCAELLKAVQETKERMRAQEELQRSPATTKKPDDSVVSAVLPSKTGEEMTMQSVSVVQVDSRSTLSSGDSASLGRVSVPEPEKQEKRRSVHNSAAHSRMRALSRQMSMYAPGPPPGQDVAQHALSPRLLASPGVTVLQGRVSPPGARSPASQSPPLSPRGGQSIAESVTSPTLIIDSSSLLLPTSPQYDSSKLARSPSPEERDAGLPGLPYTLKFANAAFADLKASEVEELFEEYQRLSKAFLESSVNVARHARSVSFAPST